MAGEVANGRKGPSEPSRYTYFNLGGTGIAFSAYSGTTEATVVGDTSVPSDEEAVLPVGTIPTAIDEEHSLLLSYDPLSEDQTAELETFELEREGRGASLYYPWNKDRCWESDLGVVFVNTINGTDYLFVDGQRVTVNLTGEIISASLYDDLGEVRLYVVVMGAEYSYDFISGEVLVHVSSVRDTYGYTVSLLDGEVTKVWEVLKGATGFPAGNAARDSYPFDIGVAPSGDEVMFVCYHVSNVWLEVRANVRGEVQYNLTATPAYIQSFPLEGALVGLFDYHVPVGVWEDSYGDLSVRYGTFKEEQYRETGDGVTIDTLVATTSIPTHPDGPSLHGTHNRRVESVSAYINSGNYSSTETTAMVAVDYEVIYTSANAKASVVKKLEQNYTGTLHIEVVDHHETREVSNHYESTITYLLLIGGAEIMIHTSHIVEDSPDAGSSRLTRLTLPNPAMRVGYYYVSGYEFGDITGQSSRGESLTSSIGTFNCVRRGEGVLVSITHSKNFPDEGVPVNYVWVSPSLLSALASMNIDVATIDWVQNVRPV